MSGGAPREEEDNCKVYISNINKNIEQDDIRRKFSEFGVIKSLILKKKQNNVTYSFIEYESSSEAQAAIREMDKQTFFDRILKVERGRGGHRGLPHYHNRRFDDYRGGRGRYEPSHHRSGRKDFSSDSRSRSSSRSDYRRPRRSPSPRGRDRQYQRQRSRSDSYDRRKREDYGRGRRYSPRREYDRRGNTGRDDPRYERDRRYDYREERYPPRDDRPPRDSHYRDGRDRYPDYRDERRDYHSDRYRERDPPPRPRYDNQDRERGPYRPPGPRYQNPGYERRENYNDYNRRKDDPERKDSKEMGYPPRGGGGNYYDRRPKPPQDVHPEPA